MMDTLLIGDVIMVDMRRSQLQSLKRGDIVVFDMPMEPEVMYLKRLIGLPGDTIEIRTAVVYVNDVPLDEPYVKKEYLQGVGNSGPIHVDENQYFMLGDHRNASYDSRDWGTVPEALLRGKVLYIYYSVSDDPESVFGSIRWERFGKSLSPPD
jgi:signal peptidase I